MMVGKVSSGPSSKRAGYHYHLRIGRGNVLVLGAVAIAILVIAGTVTYASFVLPYGNVQDKTFSYENVIGSVNGRISATLAGIQSHESHTAPHYPTSDSIGINPHIGNNPTVPYEYTPSQAPITTPTITYFTATNATGKFIRSATPINITTTGLDLSEIRNANGSITLSDNINGNVSYSDAGFVYYNVGPLSSINNISVYGNAAINLWFDVNGNGEYFSWNNNTYSGLGGDNYAMANDGFPINSVTNSTMFSFLTPYSGNYSFSLQQLKEGYYGGINGTTEVAIWVGIAVDNPAAGWPSSESTTVSVSIARSTAIPMPQGFNFNANYNSTFYKSVSPFSVGTILSESLNNNGSVTMQISAATSYYDLGFSFAYGTLAEFKVLPIDGTGPFAINLWINPQVWAWNGNMYTGLGSSGAYGEGRSTGSTSVSNTSEFYITSAGSDSLLHSYVGQTLNVSQITSIVGNSTPVDIWVGIDNGGSSKSNISATIDSIEGGPVFTFATPAPVVDSTRGWGFSSIQAGIVAAQIEDTIQVAPGTYNQQLTINKSIVLLGSLGSSTVTGPGPNPTILNGSSSISRSGILINSTSGVTISGFIIQNWKVAPSNEGDWGGITIANSSNVVISHNNLKDNNYGIMVDEGTSFVGSNDNSFGTSSNLTIVFNLIQDSLWPSARYWASGGIGITTWYSAGKNLLIANNTIINSDRNGILTGRTTGVQVTGNSIINSGWAAVELDDSINAVVDGNTIVGGYPGSAGAQGILAYSTPGAYWITGAPSNVSMTGLQIDGNSISGLASGNDAPGIAYGVYLVTAAANFTINGATITDNRISNMSDAGVFLWPYGEKITNTSIYSNELTSNAAGMNIIGNFGSVAGTTLNSNTFSNNNIQYIDSTNTTNTSQILTNNTFDRAVVVQQAQIGDPEVLANISDHIIWSNIADAVANSSSGDTVKVLPGIYPSASPIIITTSSLWIQSITGIYNDSGVYLNAASPEINLNGRPPSYFQLGGSSDPVSNAGSSVENVLIGGFNFEGAGIEVPGTGAGNISIASNSFTNTSVEAIGYHGNPSLAAPLGNIAIVYNTFKNIGTDSPGSTASAIWLGNVVNSSVGFNKINNTAYAGIILTGTEQGNESYNFIFNNTISNIPHQGIQIAYGSNDWAVGNIVTLSGMDWNVNGSGPFLGRDAAISLFNPSQDNITMVNNVLSDSYDGLAVGQVSAFSLFNDSLGSNIIFQNNNVFNLIHYGVANYAVNGTTLNAEYNWWGGPHGPNTTGSANVYGQVYYVPALSLPFNVPTASVTVNEFGLASGTVWSVTLNGTTYSTSSNSITVPNNIVLDSNTYLTEFAQGSYNISVSVGQPYYFAYWSSDTSSISFESRSAGSTVVAVNGSGTITATFGLPLDGSFTLATTPVKTVVGTIVSLNTTWRNNLPFQQVTGIVWFEVENASTGQTVMIAATSLTLTPGSSSSAYLGLSTLAPGTYNVEVFVTTSQGVPISPTTTVTVTV